MASYEIERKFLVKELPKDWENYPCHYIEQGYLCTEPVVRIRKQDEEYYLTYKGKGLLVREEYNLPLTKEAYEHLREKADGNLISKKRFILPLANSDLKIELDIFDTPFSPLMLAEVEFPSKEEAEQFVAPSWFLEDVTFDARYHNSNMSRKKL